MFKKAFYCIFPIYMLSSCTMNSDQINTGIFNAAADVGNVKHVGSTSYNPETEVYTLKGSGTNMWFDKDEFQFVWKKMSGDLIVNTQVEFIGEGVDPHRKAGLIIRESLETGSPYVSAAFHGDGLVSMQYRLEKDSSTLEFSAEDYHLPVLQIIKQSDTVVVQAAPLSGPMQDVGKLNFDFLKGKEYYVGLFVCSHNPDVVEEARFLNSRLSIPAKDDYIPYTDYIGARLEVYDFETGLRKVIFESDLPIEAPNWSPWGDYFIVNAGGLLYRIPSEGGEPEVINTDFATSNNNDHGVSPDGSQLVISHHAADRQAGQNSVIYTLPLEGGTPIQITQNSPSYWHGWSPDGKFLIYTAQRDGKWGIWRVPATGGNEVPLTRGDGLDDGSEYSQDGKYIWFNSNRSGTMEIWRMNSDGSEPKQITDDTFQNWFAHESPDGQTLVFLSYPPEVGEWDHPYYKHVMIRTLSLQGGEPVGSPKVIAYLYGGQGTMNVPNWSPDGTRVAFVSNTVLPAEDNDEID